MPIEGIVSMANSRESLLQEFVDWSAAHITGDEKGEAQIFLDRLFRAFGQKGSLDVGGTPELRIRKSSEDGGGTAFADYVWKPIVNHRDEETRDRPRRKLPAGSFATARDAVSPSFVPRELT
jgi:hypothetical protein